MMMLNEGTFNWSLKFWLLQTSHHHVNKIWANSVLPAFSLWQPALPTNQVALFPAPMSAILYASTIVAAVFLFLHSPFVCQLRPPFHALSRAIFCKQKTHYRKPQSHQWERITFLGGAFSHTLGFFCKIMSWGRHSGGSGQGEEMFWLH